VVFERKIATTERVIESQRG